MAKNIATIYRYGHDLLVPFVFAEVRSGSK